MQGDVHGLKIPTIPSFYFFQKKQQQHSILIAAFHIDIVSCQQNHPSSTQASKSNPLATPKIHQIMKTQMIKNLLPLSNEVEDEQLIPTTLSYVIPTNSHCVPAWKIIHNYNLSQSWCPY